MNVVRKVSVCFVVLLTLGAVAQTAPERILIRAGRLMDVRGGRMLTNQSIVVENGSIVSVGAAPTSVAGMKVIELPNATVLPGLIDAHTHLTFDPNFGYETLAISVPREALTGAKNARITLEAGFTTVRNVGAGGYSDIALRDSINAGELPGPHILASGPALGITGGHCDNNLLAPEYNAAELGVADGISAVQHRVRENIKYGADVIKICATGGVLSKGDDPQASQYTLEEMKAIVADAHRLGRKVAAHAHGAEGMRWASEAGVDSVEHCSYIDEPTIAVLKQHGTYIVPTLYLTQWLSENMTKIGMPEMFAKKERAIIPIVEANLRRAFASGVKVAFGTDAAVYPHGLNAHEFAMYVKLGMTPTRAIQTATVNAADLLGITEHAGTIEPGKWADIIAVDGDPSSDVTTLQHVRFVMKAGKVYKNEYAR